MATANQSLTVDQVVDTLKNTNVLQVYNNLTKKKDSAKNYDSASESKTVN